MELIPLLTVIIPNYNTEPYIQSALYSVCNEFKDSLEVIVIDDGSTDNSINAIEQFIDKDTSGSVIKLITQANKGPGHARNQALALAKGSYFGFLDSDDIYLPGIATTTIPLMKAGDSDIIEYHFSRINLQGDLFRPSRRFYKFVGKYGLNELLPTIFARTAWYPSIRFFRRQIWSGIAFPEGVYYEDPMTIYQLYRRAKSIYFLEQPFLAYRLREGSITRTFTEKKYTDLYKFFNSIEVTDLSLAILKIRIGRTLVRFSNLLGAKYACNQSIYRSINDLRSIYLYSLYVLKIADILFLTFPRLYSFIDKQYSNTNFVYFKEKAKKLFFKIKAYF